MKISEIFENSVTRTIAPVVYFHEQTPSKLAAEVNEYIVTGGYPAKDVRSKRVPSGIHEQFVRLLRGIAEANERADGGERASWISGFYGSGKSSFAKLLGLAFDGVMLPNGKPLADALLARDDSPLASEFADAWRAATSKAPTIAVVFDIGGESRDNEQIHVTTLRQVQRRLGYSKSTLVARHELKLERDGEWNRFLAASEKLLGMPWSQAKDKQLTEDHFSHVLHIMDPDRYRDPTSWIDSRAGAATGEGTSAREVVDEIDAMLSIRDEDKRLFIVIDEVSQYIHQDETRMLGLQSFVSDLGQRLKGKVWIFCTGQQKLEQGGDASNIGKLKDRFPTALRVHLDSTNIRDVVHKRLLKKKATHEPALRALFAQHRSDLKNYAFGCDEITEEDFVETYPLLPSQIDLLMRITTELRGQSRRAQGDAHAIRGLLQLLGDLFREQKLADSEVGRLVTLDIIYAVQSTALDVDVQTTLSRIFDHPDVRHDELAVRVAKAVALLELISETTATTAELVAQCLYRELGQGNQVPLVTAALERMRALALLSYSEKHGFKIQSSAGQEWQKERDDIQVSPEQRSRYAQDLIKELVGSAQERPKWKGRSFPWSLYFSDGQQFKDVKLQDARDDSTVTVDFRLTSTPVRKVSANTSAQWLALCALPDNANKILWVAGDTAPLEDALRELGRSERMVERGQQKRQSLSREKLELLAREEQRLEDLRAAARRAVELAFVSGETYFRGQATNARSYGTSFATAMIAAATRALPELYPYFSEITISPAELAQLLQDQLAGPSQKFMEATATNVGLGILSMDAGKYIASCTGSHPTRVLAEIAGRGGASGAALVSMFVGPPYGYAPDVLKACIAGLLRGGKLRIVLDKGDELKSYKDPGVSDLFHSERVFRSAEYFPAAEDQLTPRDRTAIRKLFEKYANDAIDNDNEALADAAFKHFPKARESLRAVETLLARLPNRPGLPPVLKKFAVALENGNRSRKVDETVNALKRDVDTLRDGFELLAVYKGDLTEAAITAVRAADDVRTHELAQLQTFGSELHAADAAWLTEQLATERPWREAGRLAEVTAQLKATYAQVRRDLLNEQYAAAEAVRSLVKLRPDFARLDDDQAYRALLPINAALVDTTPTAVAPTLLELRDRVASRLPLAEDQANDAIDGFINDAAKPPGPGTSPQPNTSTPVVKVETNFRGRVVTNREELHAVFKELEARLGPHFDRGARVRLS